MGAALARVSTQPNLSVDDSLHNRIDGVGCLIKQRLDERSYGIQPTSLQHRQPVNILCRSQLDHQKNPVPELNR